MNKKYTPGNYHRFPRHTLRIGVYFNPRIAALFRVLTRLGITRNY